MKPLVLIGNGKGAEMIYHYLTEYSTREIVAFSVDKQYIDDNNSHFMDLPIVPLEELQELYPPSEFEVILGVGYSRMNDVRKKLFMDCKKKGYKIASFIHPAAVIANNVTMGEGNLILESTVIGPFSTIGDGNTLWSCVKFAHHIDLGDFNFFSVNSSVVGFTKIGNNCFFGTSSIVYDHMTVADYTLLGGGAILKWDTYPYEVVVPAKSVTLEGKKSIDFFR